MRETASVCGQTKMVDLERQSTFSKSLVLIFIYLFLEIEAVSLNEKGFSFKFGAPAVCYFITNIIYLHSLTVTAPPIWMVLIQTRTLYTACFYKIFLKKEVTDTQITGCLLIVASIGLTRFSELSSGHVTISLYVLSISQVAAMLSSVACLAVELLLKNDSRSFMEQQFWLYLFGASLASITLFATESVYSLKDSISGLMNKPNTIGLLSLAMTVSASAGLCIPLIIKNLDSIVKDYLAALNNILLALLTAFLFPRHFPINSIYAVSLTVLISGIFLYERKTITWPKLYS